MRLRGWLWILAVVLLGTFAGLRLRTGQAIETNLLAMLPATERNPVAEEAVKALAQATGERAVFLVGGMDPERSKAAALGFARDLEASGAFTQVQGALPPLDPGMIPRFYAPYRFALPSPGEDAAFSDRGALLQQIQARLASPRAAGFGLGLAEDPLGRMEAFLGALPLSASHLELQDNLLVLHGSDGLYVLCTAALKGSAFDPRVQEATRRAVAQAEGHLRSAHPEAKLLRTGAIFYALDARTRAEGEMHLISSISLVCILLIYLLVFRSLRHLLLGLLCVGAGLVTATALSLAVFGKLYLLTLVCGASVLGDAVDYSFLYFANHLADSGNRGRASGLDEGDRPLAKLALRGEGAPPSAANPWEPWSALGRIRKPLVQGFLTTMLGYAALMLAPFPGLRQIALFSMVGLLGAFLTVLCVLPACLARPARPRPRMLGGLSAFMTRAHGWAQARRLPMVLVTAVVLLGALALRSRTQDDVQGFIRPSASLFAEETRIRELTGISNQGIFYLVEGATEGETLAREEALRERLAPLLQTGELDGIQALSSFVPSPSRQAVELDRQRQLAPALEGALGDLGMRPEVIQALERDRSATKLLRVADWLEAPFSMPFRMLWMGPTGRSVATLVLPMGPASGERLAQVAKGLPGVQLVDKAASVSRAMAKDRRLATWSLGGALILVWGLLALWYGPRTGFWLIAPPLCGILLALAGTALFGVSLNLFAVLGFFLVLGWGVDYTVFLRMSRPGESAGVLGVILAALLTLVSYGLLAFSHTPALRGFGIVLAWGILGTALTSFLALRARPVQDGG